MKNVSKSYQSWLSSRSNRILVLRIAVTGCLMVAAAIVGSMSYLVLRNNESEIADLRYHQITRYAATALEDESREKNEALLSFAKSYAYTKSNASEWPLVTLPGFYDTAETLRGALGLYDITFFPLVVLPEQLPEFEQFLFDYFQSEPTIANTEEAPGRPELGEVVFAVDASSPAQLYHDTTGEALAYTSPNRLIAPITQHLLTENFPASSLAFNGHSLPEIGPSMDFILECSKTVNYLEATKICSSMSAPFSLPVRSVDVQDIKTLLLQPIYLGQNSSNLVGFIAGGVLWKNILQESFPQYLQGIDCVVVHGNESFTYTTTGDGVEFFGVGDRHDRKYNRYVREARILDGAYTVYIYPHDAYFEHATSNNPLLVSIGSVILILICSGIFLLYDVLMRRESSAKTAVLDTKRRFVRFISHEVRTPLNAVHLSLESLAAELSTAMTLLEAFLTGSAESPLALLSSLSNTLHGWQELAAEMMSNSESAVDVLDDLLNYDKIEMGTLRLEFTRVNLWEVVKSTATAFHTPAQEKRVALTVKPCSLIADIEQNSCNNHFVVGDSGRIAQVLRNLISNALKFTPSGGRIDVAVKIVAGGLPEVKVSVPDDQAELLEHPRAGSIRVSVTDSGAGLSPEQLAAICSEGAQFTANELQAGQGSGLGLFISKGLAEQHGGKLVVTSDGIGAGTTFTMELPLFRDASADDAFAGSLPSASPSLSYKFNRVSPLLNKPISALPLSIHRSPLDVDKEPLRLLLVDDAASNRKVLSRLLTAKGYICEQAEDGQECINMYLQLQREGMTLQAILMDSEMPVMNGPTAAKHLRELGCTVPIIGVTGNLLPEDVKLFISQGATAVLGKPLSIPRFEALLKQYVPRGSGGNGFRGGVVPLECEDAASCAATPRGAELVTEVTTVTKQV